MYNYKHTESKIVPNKERWGNLSEYVMIAKLVENFQRQYSTVRDYVKYMKLQEALKSISTLLKKNSHNQNDKITEYFLYINKLIF